MTVDKQNKDVCYNDEEHTYWNKDGTFISVTTLIGKFCPKFDKDFWSAYKAIEKLLSKEEFAMVKGEMQKTHRVDVEGLMNIYGFTLNDFNREQQNILDEWQKTNKDSCERGTEIHAILEQQYTSKKTTDLNHRLTLYILDILETPLVQQIVNLNLYLSFATFLFGLNSINGYSWSI